MQQHLVVIGGGAAGFFCAINAARLKPQLQVTILEKTGKLLSKVRVSGGGRCNVTHHCFELPELVKKYPRGEQFLKKAFHWFNTTHTIQWFKERGVTLKVEADGRMFPTTNNAETIAQCLLQEASQYGVQITTHTEVQSIIKNEAGFLLQTNHGVLQATQICVATGGYAKALQFGWLQQLGHGIEMPVPSLFTFNMPQHPITQLMGISLPMASIKVIGSKLQSEGPILITHWGLSGPCVLKLSAFGARTFASMNYQFSILVNWLHDIGEEQLRQAWPNYRQQQAAQKMQGKNPFGLPNRLWLFLLEQAAIGEQMRWADLPAKQQNQLIKLLTAMELQVKGKTTFKEEFVTCGGIRLQEIDVNTMQSKKIAGLYFAGEVLDVDGITGGFNFQNAWTTAFIAAKSITQTD